MLRKKHFWLRNDAKKQVCVILKLQPEHNMKQILLCVSTLKSYKNPVITVCTSQWQIKNAKVLFSRKTYRLHQRYLHK